MNTSTYIFYKNNTFTMFWFFMMRNIIKLEIKLGLNLSGVTNVTLYVKLV